MFGVEKNASFVSINPALELPNILGKSVNWKSTEKFQNNYHK